MNKEWSQKNKEIQVLLGKESTYKEGIQKLISFREELFEQISNIVSCYPKEAFYQMPFKDANGYHSKTLAYSIWHIFRIEDIVAHELIEKDQQILFTDLYEQRIHAPVITTGNELDSEKIVTFSKKVDVDELLSYANAVMESTNNSSLEHLNKFGLQMFYTADMENVYYARDMDCFIVAEMEENTLLLQSVICENHVTLLEVLQRVRGEYHKCQLGFVPALKDMDMCMAEKYDGADDYRLFYLGEQLKSIENEKLYFPGLSHA